MGTLTMMMARHLLFLLYQTVMEKAQILQLHQERKIKDQQQEIQTVMMILGKIGYFGLYFVFIRLYSHYQEVS